MLAGDGAMADIVAEIDLVPVDRIYLRIGDIPCSGYGIAQSHNAEHATAAGDDVVLTQCGASMKHLAGIARSSWQAID